MWIYLKSVLAVVLTLIATSALSHQAQRIIYGLDHAQHFHAKRLGHYYIQLGSFSKQSNALNLTKILNLRTKLPVVVQQKQGRYVVLVGPMPTDKVVRDTSAKLTAAMAAKMPTKTRRMNKIVVKRSVVTPAKIHAPVVRKQQTVFRANHPYRAQVVHHRPVASKVNNQQAHKISPVSKDTAFTTSFLTSLIPTQQQWFVSVGAGAQYSELNGIMTVNNNTGFPPPSNNDLYTTKNNNQAIITAAAGRRWQNNSTWLPSLSLGVLYEHFFPINIGNTVIEYALPAFTDYNYGLKISSDAVFASGKLNLFQCHLFSPYITGAFGGGFNHAYGYNETALPGVTARTSPAFVDNISNQFAYNAGAGFDFQFTPQLLLSVGYLYQNLGNVSSGQGTQAWAGQSLNVGTFRSNDVVANVTYLFGS